MDLWIVLGMLLTPNLCVGVVIGLCEIRRAVNKHRYLKGNR
jgi:hypothetical protein